jgi:hypothetical protein
LSRISAQGKKIDFKLFAANPKPSPLSRRHPPAMADDYELAALHEQVALASSAAVSASDLDLAFQLQVSEAIEARFEGQTLRIIICQHDH